jgi:hypothetical protein
MKNSNDTIGNRSRDLPVFKAVHKPLRDRVPHINNVRVIKDQRKEDSFHWVDSVILADPFNTTPLEKH